MLNKRKSQLTRIDIIILDIKAELEKLKALYDTKQKKGGK